MTQQDSSYGPLPTLFSLFPTPVVLDSLERDFSAEELDFLLNLPTRGNEGNVTSTDSYILENKLLRELKKVIEAKTNNFFEKIYKPTEGVKLRITQSWVNYTSPGGYHHSHNHPNSFVSGVLYIRANPEIDLICFNRPPTERLVVDTVEFSDFTTGKILIPVKTGILALFPSSLSHNVPVTSGEEDRISLSFNTFFQGVAGTKLSLNELIVR